MFSNHFGTKKKKKKNWNLEQPKVGVPNHFGAQKTGRNLEWPKLGILNFFEPFWLKSHNLNFGHFYVVVRAYFVISLWCNRTIKHWVNGVFFGAEGCLQNNRCFDTSEFELHGFKCVITKNRSILWHDKHVTSFTAHIIKLTHFFYCTYYEVNPRWYIIECIT